MMKMYFDLLGLPKNFSEEELKLAYKDAVKKHHPDRFLNEKEKTIANEKFILIQEAYNYFKNNPRDIQQDMNLSNAFKLLGINPTKEIIIIEKALKNKTNQYILEDKNPITLREAFNFIVANISSVVINSGTNKQEKAKENIDDIFNNFFKL